MQNEYEAKFLNINARRIKKILISLGAKLVKPRKLLKRVIFENEILKAQHSWIRLRDEGGKITLTLKQVTDSSTIQGTKELEIVVDDFSKTDRFLEAIGLERKRYQENYREEWRLNNIKFDFDTWPDIPTFLEIEGHDELSVKSAAEKLGFDYKKAKFGSIDTLYLQEYNRDILKEELLLFKK